MNIGSIVLLGLAGLAYAIVLLLMSELGRSDAAGNGLTSAFAAIGMFVQWLLLAVLMLVGGPRGQKLSGLALVALCAALSWTGMVLLNDSFYRSRWPLLLPALAPLLAVAFLFRGRLVIPAAAAAAALLALGLGAAAYRSRFRERDRASRAAAWEQAEKDRFNRLTPDSPLRSWLEYTAPGSETRAKALAAIRQSPRRQAELEQLLREGSHYLTRDLPEFDVKATEPVCNAGRRCLRELIDDLGPLAGGSPRFLVEGARILEYQDGIRWLVENGCPLRRELEDLVAAVALYQETPQRTRFLEFAAALSAAAAE